MESMFDRAAKSSRTQVTKMRWVQVDLLDLVPERIAPRRLDPCRANHVGRVVLVAAAEDHALGLS